MRSKLKILVAESEGFSTQARHLLAGLGTVELADLDHAALWNTAPRADVLWVRLRHRLDAEFLAHCPRLKAIVSPTTGLNHIDLEEAARRGVRVFSLRGEAEFLKDVRATAEHTIALMLSLLRHVPAAVHSVRNGRWDRDAHKGSELYGKTVGVVGLGRLGKLVAGYLQAFGCNVLAADPLFPTGTHGTVPVVPLDTLLEASDLVTLHVNLDRNTEDLFGWEQFRRMKLRSWFVNTSRGELVVESALLRALEAGCLAGAAVDVLRGEQSGEALEGALARYAREHDNLLITPHMGGCTFESMDKTEVFLASKVLTALAPDLSKEAVPAHSAGSRRG